MFFAKKAEARDAAQPPSAPFTVRGMRIVRLQLTGLFILILAFTLVAFSSVLYKVFQHSHQSSFDVALYNHAVDIAGSIHVDPFGELSVDAEMLQSEGKIFPFALGRAFIQVRRQSGEVTLRSATLRGRTLPLKQEDLVLVLNRGYTMRTVQYAEITGRSSSGREENPKAEYRLLSYLMRNLPDGYVLQVAVPMTFLEFSTRGLERILIFGIPFTLVAAAFAGLYLARRAMQPIHAAFDSQERFIADASHELKTPVAILRGELDVLCSRERAPKEVNEFLVSASQELLHLSRIIEDLLLLARMDQGGRRLEFADVRLDEIAIEVAARLEVLARPREVKLHFDLIRQSGEAEAGAAGEFLVRGDSDLLRSLVKNLVENAIKFSCQGGTVSVRLEDSAGDVRVSVSDEGPGIPDEQRARVFERFYRAPGEGRKVAGAGLGLTIARRIAEAHGSVIEVRSNALPAAGPTGSSFSVAIKKS